MYFDSIHLSRSIASYRSKAEATHCTEFEQCAIDLTDEASVRAFFTSGSAYSAFIYRDGYRNAAKVERMTCLILDFDNKDPDAIYSIETEIPVRTSYHNEPPPR